MATGQLSERARITSTAAGYLSEHKRSGEAIGLAVEPARPGSWTLVLRIGEVGVSAHCGPSPDDATLTGALIGLLRDARKQAELGERVRGGTVRLSLVLMNTI